MPVLLLAAFLLSGCERETAQQASAETVPQVTDLVLMNGGIYTVDAERNWAQAAAIVDGLFIAVGDNSEIETYI